MVESKTGTVNFKPVLHIIYCTFVINKQASKLDTSELMRPRLLIIMSHPVFAYTNCASRHELQMAHKLCGKYPEIEVLCNAIKQSKNRSSRMRHEQFTLPLNFSSSLTSQIHDLEQQDSEAEGVV
jgi:hypothetical protein